MSRVQSSGETAIHSTRAAAYNYDAETKSWVSVDGGASRIFIFHNPQAQSYRIIGLANEKYIINSPIYKGMIYQKVSDKFIQWRDSVAIYGLSFISSEELESFTSILEESLKKLNLIGMAATAALPPPLASMGGTSTPPTAQKVAPPPPKRTIAVTNPNPNANIPSTSPRSRRSSTAAPNSAPTTPTATYDLLTQADSLLSQREKIIKEIYTSEKEYVNKLTQLVEQCYDVVEKGKYKNVFSESEKKIIYGNVRIVMSMNVNFKQALQDRFSKWHDQEMVGNVFLQMIPFFRVYKEYFTNYESGVELLEKLSKKKEVNAYLKHCEQVADGQKLPYLLIMPVQRIPRYVLLLTELMKFTEADHPDYENIQNAIEQLRDFTMHANESVRETEHSKRFTETLKDPKKYIGFDTIVAPHRSLVYEMDVTVKFGEKEYTWMLIFSDLLVFASASGKKRMVEVKIPLDQVWFEDLGSLGPDKIRVVTPDKMYLVETSSSKPIEKQKCMTIAEKTIVAYLKSKGFDHSTNGNDRKFNYEFSTGVKYDGEWSMGKPNGSGKYTYIDGNIYIGDFDQGRRSGPGKMVYTKNAGIYEGHWLNDKPHGQGKMEAHGTVYEGEFVAGQRNGTGRVRWPNGDVYEGQWSSDRMHGLGKLTTSTAVYEGSFDFNMFHGEGKLVWPGGSYEGHWDWDRKSGQGTMTYPTEDLYVGEWKDDQRHGQGVLTTKTFVYEGNWDSDKMNGVGKLTVFGKFTYNGSFKDDRKHGPGNLLYDDGSSYEGGWADDRKEGQGLWKSATGEVYDGYWHSDKKFGKGKITYPDGSSYDGEWVNNRKEGKGTFVWCDGTKYSGNWTSDKRHGKGVLNAPDESYKYAGDWANDYKHGKGILTDHTGSYEGEWKDDKQNGPGFFTKKSGEVFEGNWTQGLLDGDATLTRKDGNTVQLFFKDCCMEKPGFDVLPPNMPFIKIISP